MRALPQRPAPVRTRELPSLKGGPSTSSSGSLVKLPTLARPSSPWGQTGSRPGSRTSASDGTGNTDKLDLKRMSRVDAGMSPRTPTTLMPQSEMTDDFSEADGGLQECEEIARSLAHPLAELTCSSWHIVEVPSFRTVLSSGTEAMLQLGKVAPSEVRPVASLTKMMTAYLVMQKVDAGWCTLATLLMVSERAANARGTLANLQAGDTLSVEQLLYALMLPSGNDAGVVFAEHFGGKQRDLRYLDAGEAWPVPVGADSEARVQRFVAEMNARARDLGLARTFFDSPHGFESAELAYQRRVNTASCEDMCKLIECVMEDERLRRIAGTKSYSTVYFHRPTCMNSKLVRQKWENNSFLDGVEGWVCGKSGGSPNARYCMSTVVTVDGVTLAGVTLGSANKQLRLRDNQLLWAHAASIVRGTVRREEPSNLDGDEKWTPSEQL